MVSVRLARFQAKWTPVSRPESALTLRSGARSDAKPDSTFAERALARCFGRAYRCKGDERDGREDRDHGEHRRIRGPFRDEGKDQRGDRLHRQVRSPDAAHEMSIAGRP